MKWENLKQNKCPHCSEDLYQEDDELRCTSCLFHIHQDRAASIRRHRSNPTTEGTLKMKWQNLHDGKCPICSDILMNIGGFHNTFKCASYTCSFAIRQQRMQEMLEDPDHPTNRFRKPEDNSHGNTTLH